MANALTVKGIEQARIPGGKEEHVLYDGDNLMLRLRSTRAGGLSRNWILRYTHLGVRHKLSLGSYPLLSLADARAAAEENLKVVHSGVDPKEVERNRRAQALADQLVATSGEVPQTVQELFDRWEATHLKVNHHDQGSYVSSHFQLHILPLIGPLQLSLLRVSHITSVLDSIRAKGLTRSCGIALTNLRQMFRFGITREWLAGDPTMTLKASSWKGDGQESDRVLSLDEIQSLVPALAVAKLPKVWEHTVWLLLAAGTRIKETTLMERSHVDLVKRTWRIPAANQKKVATRGTPKDHVVHLSEFAAHHMECILRLSKGVGYVYPANVRGDDGQEIPTRSKTLSQMLRDRQKESQHRLRGRVLVYDSLVLPGGPWSPHDLRRTMSTEMQELGVDPHIIDKCQNHAIPQKVRRTYQRATLANLTRDAWDRWGAKLDSLVGRTT